MSAKQSKRLSLDLRQQDVDLINHLTEEKDMSITQVVRQALRLYQLAHETQKNGREIKFADATVVLL